ncbi:MAG TPA: hypothetical protein VI282_05655, partial [Verrucomicrobiae bacterium]
EWLWVAGDVAGGGVEGLSELEETCQRLLSFWIRAVLRFSSFARSAIEADDSVPVPVFEKCGSGL